MRLQLLAAALIGAACMALPTVGSAAPLGALSKDLSTVTQSADNGLLVQVQRRGNRGGRVVRRGRGRGGGVNAGAAAVGAMIGVMGAIMAEEAARRSDAVEYCMERYRSYNPETGTWVDRRGRVHSCP